VKSIEIVTHAWAGRYAHYGYALTYQLSSLILHPHKSHVTVTVCYNPVDKIVCDVLGFFENKFNPAKVKLHTIPCTLPNLGRRAIGRNVAAITATGDIVWFTDCDYVFGEDCLDALAEVTWPSFAPMVFPKTVLIHRDHATGDVALAKAAKPCLINVEPDDFIPKKYSRAIGGVQIVKGDFAREHGYIPDNKRRQTPYHHERGFDQCRCDLAYRRFVASKGSILPITLPHCYRLRHSQTTHHDFRKSN